MTGRHYLHLLCVCGTKVSISSENAIEMMVNDWWREHAKACIFARQTLRELDRELPSPQKVCAGIAYTHDWENFHSRTPYCRRCGLQAHS